MADNVKKLTVKKPTAKLENPLPKGPGLIGMFGHRMDDNDDIQNQFVILREVNDATYVIQLFSYLDGRPTDCEIVTLDELISKRIKLYASEWEWIYQSSKRNGGSQSEAMLDADEHMKRP